MNAIKIFIVLGLAIGAATANYFYLNSTELPQPGSFVRVNGRIAEGSKLTEALFEEVKIAGTKEDLDELAKTALPYKDRTVLYDQLAPREFMPKDLLLWRDSTRVKAKINEPVLHISLEGVEVSISQLKVGDLIVFKTPKSFIQNDPDRFSYDTVGPFRIVSIGEQTEILGDQRNARGSTEKYLTIALIKRTKNVESNQDKPFWEEPMVDKLLSSLRQVETDSRAKVHLISAPRLAQTSSGVN